MVYGGFLNFRPQYSRHGQRDIARTGTRKEFLFCEEEDDSHAIAEELSSRFFTHSPDAILSFVTGNQNFHSWKRDDYQSALQAGIVKLLSTFDLMVIDDGLNYGLTRLVSAAIRVHEEYRNYVGTAGVVKYGEPRNSPVYHLAFVVLSKMSPICRGRFQEFSSHTEGFEFDVDEQFRDLHDSGRQIDIERLHSHYVLFQGRDYTRRILAERQLQIELALRDLKTATESVFMPLVVFFIQGGLEELDRIALYIDLRVPVIIMDGCGGMADLVANALRTSLENCDESTIRRNLSASLLSAFPALHEDSEQLQRYVDKLHCIVKECGPATKRCYIIDCGRLETFDNLDVPLLQAIISSSEENHMNWDQFVRNFLLCVKCNRMEVVSQCLWDCPPWNTVYNEWEVNQFTYPGLVASLILPGREAFVDMLLYQKFPVRFLTSHLDLLHFFQKAGDRQTFLSLVWQDILGHSQTDAIGEGFILTELNPLIHQLTDVRNFLDLYELSRIALTRNDGTADPIESDSNSLSALIVYAVLMNRPKLVMVLIKHSSDPIPHIVFAETMYRNLSKASRNVELHMALKRQAENMGKIAADILDVGIRESPLRTQTFFQRVIPAFNSKTLLRMAFDARNRRFISHPLVQDWLDHFASSFIRIKGTNRELKLVLSAYLIFPMYLWLTFPRHLRRDRHFAQTKDVTYIREPKSGVTPVLSFPSFPGMIYAVWSAPLVKFWTWFISYVMFLILIGVDMMTPACTNISLDIAVFIWATLILVDLTLRTIQHYLWRKRRQPVIRNVYHIFSQFIFLSLFFPYRIAPYRYEHPFAGRVILAFGVLYYYYAVWGIFFTFFRPLGPLVKIFSMMFKLDLPRWIAVITPFLIASSVVWQAVITPDYPMGGEVWRRAITRQISVLFGGLSNELEFNAACERTSRINWSNFSHPPDRCWVGAYSDYTCNTVSAWSYIFMASYYVFLKFGMMIMLVVIYTARFSLEMNKATLMWKYERFQTLFEHYWRTSLPFPLSICGSVYLIYLHYVYGKQLTEPATDPELGNLKMDTFIYWKSVAIEYFAQIDREESNRSVGRQHSSLLGTMKKDMRAAMGKVDELDRKVAHSNGKLRDLQERYRPIARRLAVVSALNPVRHVRSRLETYPDTTLQRTTVADHQLSWMTPMPNYNPPTYTTVTKEGTSDSQGVHDTWISDEDGEWIRYEFDSTGLPRNPSGRTGLGGRGIYLQYGPNRRIVLAITTANRDGRLAFIATDGERNQANLPVVSEIRSESGYPEAGRLLLDVFCCASHRVKVNYDPLKLQTKAALRQLMQLVLGSQPPCRYPKEEISFQVDIRAIYRGYLDSSLNTDNAWAEVLVLHVSVPDIQLPAPSVYYWLDLASRGTLSHHIDSDILEYLAV